MSWRSKYARGMDDIQVSDELRRTIRNRVEKQAAASPARDKFLHNMVIRIAASCVIVLLLAVGGWSVAQRTEESSIGHTGMLQNLVITAYASDGAPVVMTPEVEFPLGQYSMLMSSVPGFPITIECKDADKIKLRASEGKFLLWSQMNTKVRPQGKELTVKL
ncbi:hypothetical protein ACFO9Q_00585 [Paenibacillus sp. GCM10023252]|uniref:hypothetical protein n=1 Tax=Paenibacillus sp. GCM10023252 TaxID=3252649 RepID=UPI0036145D6F